MNFSFAFAIFIVFMLCSLIWDFSMLFPLFAGFLLFFAAAVKKGFSFREVLCFASESLKDSFVVIRILLLIGCLTGMWRLSGTVAYFVTLGISFIPPRFFLLAAFLLASAMSYAIGTSFGVTATAGVILMSIARAGGVVPVLAAGAVLSGVYVGDRGSPAASSANLVAVLTHTDMRKNVRMMLRSSLIPFLLCCAAYTLLSLFTPMQAVGSEITVQLGEEFVLYWPCIIPAVLMIILPFLGLGIQLSMLVSLAVSALVALFVQKAGMIACFRSMVFGYHAVNPQLSDMLSGGGIVSMLEVCAILVISCSYGGIFQRTGMLDSVNQKLQQLSGKIGRFSAMLILALGVCAVFCNQTIGAIMQNNLSLKLYGETEEEKTAKMLDMENSVILLAGLVPWCIASSVPLAMMDAGISSLPFAFFLWFTPLWWLLRTGIQCKKPSAASRC